MNWQAIDTYIQKHLQESIDELGTLVAQPSISAKNQGLQEAAYLTAKMLKARGFSVVISPTSGAPVVFAERKGRSDKTLLFYNHYDVQPAEPLELWDTPPFELVMKDSFMYGRGISDDKGHFTSRLHAIDAFLEVEGNLPCNVKFLLEGEEETSSVHLNEYVGTHVAQLKSDACVWEFGGVDEWEYPLQYLGLRGICYVELSVETANQDVHSGTGGSIFPNAAWRLVWALSTLKDENENILIPGFYDDIIPPTSRERELMEALPDPAPYYKNQYGIKHFLKGTAGGADLRMQEVYEPTCTICGLTSGYQGEGSKTVLPARASAKIDFRLVPGMRPENVLTQLREHLDASGFADVEVTYLGGGAASRTDPEDPFVKMVVDCAKEVYGVPMRVIPMVGGSGPNALVQDALDIPIVTAGIGHPASQAHAPNENVRIDLYEKGARHIARILKYFGENLD
jgi:acetylornithine deacetylase/succinyl-diaminopimelate desuccinylase-like protein